MATRIYPPSVLSAVAAAATQPAQLAALADPWGGGNVQARIYGAGGQHLRTLTLGPWSFDSNTPRGLVAGAVLADTAIAPITPGAAAISGVLWEFRLLDNTPIFASDSVTHGPIKALCKPTFAAGSALVVFTADPGLPLGGSTTALGTLAASMSAGDWEQLAVTGLSTSLFIDPGPASNTLNYMDKGCHDPVHRQIRFFGQAHLGDLRMHQFDEDTNTFSNLADPPWDTGGSGWPGYYGHGYQHNAIDPATGDLYCAFFNSGEIQHHDRALNTWSAIANHTISGSAGSRAIEWLPEIGTSGGLILVNAENVLRWTKSTNTWATVATISNRGDHPVAVRDGPGGIVHIGGGNSGPALWSVGPTGGVTSLTDCPVGFGVAQSVTTACPVTGDLLVIRGSANARQWNGTTWSTLTIPAGPPFPTAIDSGSNVVAVQMPAHGVVAFIFGSSNQFWLYKHG